MFREVEGAEGEGIQKANKNVDVIYGCPLEQLIFVTLMSYFGSAGYMNFCAQASILIGLFFANYVIDFTGEIIIIFCGGATQAAIFLIFAYVK